MNTNQELERLMREAFERGQRDRGPELGTRERLTPEEAERMGRRGDWPGTSAPWDPRPVPGSDGDSIAIVPGDVEEERK